MTNQIKITYDLKCSCCDVYCARKRRVLKGGNDIEIPGSLATLNFTLFTFIAFIIHANISLLQ